MSKGYVYVLSNPSMPGLLKIGRSENDPQIRAQQLYTTGVPTPFTIEFVWFSDDCVAAESEIHCAFAQERVRGREFFRAEVGTVIQYLVSPLISEHGLSIVTEQTECDSHHLDYLSGSCGLSTEEFLQAVSEIPTEELHLLLARHKGRQRGLAHAIKIDLQEDDLIPQSNVVAFAGACNGKD